MFLNENDLFEIRLNTHWEFVDKFIVVEAGETHTGLKKTLKFDHERFKPYSEKLVYVTFDNFEEEMLKYPELLDDTATRDRGPHVETADWTRDHFQANYLYKVLLDQGATDNDIVYLSCLDELISPDSFKRALTAFEDKHALFRNDLRPVVPFNLYLYAYKFNLLHKDWTDHVAGLVTEVGNFKKYLPATIRSLGLGTHTPVENGGWHFTFLDPTDGELVLEKQKSWAHSKDRYPGKKLKFENQTTEEALERFFEDYYVEMVEISEETHPKYIVDNIDRLQNFIYRND
jgi:beta-1,4-mannosyl-glycoprotein beta-1,4-N-acetylglucosaminyltransferase